MPTRCSIASMAGRSARRSSNCRARVARFSARVPMVSGTLSHTSAVRDIGVRRVDLGYFVRPAEETGTGSSRVEPCLGYLVDHSGGLLLLDTGMGRHPEVDARYRPRRRPLSAALAAAGARAEDVRLVVNCHLHFDHCGGNPDMTGRPIFTQRVELETAR